MARIATSSDTFAEFSIYYCVNTYGLRLQPMAGKEEENIDFHLRPSYKERGNICDFQTKLTNRV